jgi:hypothetical protein
MVLEEYESVTNRDNASDNTIALLRTDLFLDLSFGEELDRVLLSITRVEVSLTSNRCHQCEPTC